MNRKDKKFWKSELETLDKLYESRMRGWQRLVDVYNLKFEKKIRDLGEGDLVRVSRFYPLVRQIIASVCFNYPKMFFTVEDDEAQDNGIEDILERAAQSLMRLTHLREHMHQAVMDSMFAAVGWIRVDYNPPGDELIAPYVANDAMAEDLVAYNRVPPGFVHLDPLCPPHMLSHARYIREKMWLPLKALRDDKAMSNTDRLTGSAVAEDNEFGFGELNSPDTDDAERDAIRQAVENGDYVLCDRIHDRINRRMILLADGDVEHPLQEIAHPFARMVFPQVVDAYGEPIYEQDGVTPVFDTESGQEAPGWLTVGGTSFTPVRFDMSTSGYYPLPPLEYVEDLQYAIVESMSRQAALLKRTARQTLFNEEELLQRPNLAADIARGVDGEGHAVIDHNNIKPLEYSPMPADQFAFEDRARAYEEEITNVSELNAAASAPKTATESALLASAASINREWMEGAVSRGYENCVRSGFQIMGDPRYTPENFMQNVAPDGETRMSRALRSADFLWNYRLYVQTGSMQPLFEQIQREQSLGFWDRATQRQGFDQVQLDKYLCSLYDVVDPGKYLKDDINPEAEHAAQLENDRIISQLQDPGVVEGQDHDSHAATHQRYQEHPLYQQLVQAAQLVNAAQVPINPQAAQQIQIIDQIMAGHIQRHAQLQQAEQGNLDSGRSAAPAQGAADTLMGQVQSNAQKTAGVLRTDAQTAMSGGIA